MNIFGLIIFVIGTILLMIKSNKKVFDLEVVGYILFMVGGVMIFTYFSIPK